MRNGLVVNRRRFNGFEGYVSEGLKGKPTCTSATALRVVVIIYLVFLCFPPAGTLYSSCVRSVMMLVCQFVRIHSSSGLWVVWTMWSLSSGSWNRTGWTSSYSCSYCQGRHPSMVRYTFTCNSWRAIEHFSDDNSAQPQTFWLVLKYVCIVDRIFQY